MSDNDALGPCRIGFYLHTGLNLPRGRFSWAVLLVEENVGLGVLDTRLGDLGHALVIKLIPQVVEVIPAVGDVVATCIVRPDKGSVTSA